MRNAILVPAVIFSLIGAGSLAAEKGTITCGAPYMGTDNGAVIVATITRVLDKKATNGHPPQLQLQVEEVLRGELKPNRYLAIWSPPPHDIDYGDVVTNPRYIQWRATPLAAPKVDTKWILWGEMSPANRQPNSVPVFRTNPFHCYAYSAERRAWSIEQIRAGQQRQRDYAKQKEMEKRHWESALASWQANFTEKKIGELSQQADVIVVAKEAGYSSSPKKQTRFTFRVSQVLKGNLRQPFERDKTWIYVSTEGTLTQLLQRQGHQLPDYEWILFLTHTGLVPSRATGSPDHYQMLDNNSGIFAVDPSHVEAISKILGK
ncbi:hypothetical protein Pan97_52290 [Bremerella volcania]|uniref:Uncharacterized protein n=1 Tax=Bremerella volcania TaxID=2527984 RepID=A0A518CG12_9BACT|nr:hypothetical protein [Bremerella volcania]QDU78147.1 hypothetical protein Pan97_52290 [Bremerella volcania]